VSFLEFFGIGKSAPGAIERLDAFTRDGLEALRSDLAGTGVRVGFQPHATNTVDLGVYRWVAALAGRLGVPLATHLAETAEERRFIERGDGPQRAMLERFGIWDESVLHHAGRGLGPVRHLEPVLRTARVLCAHVNDASDDAVGLLAGTKTPVVYCPRASEYFGASAHFGPHRYDHMLRSGVPVCLGTDSIVNLDTPDRISVLDEMRLLALRDGAGAGTLLAMATTHGARALGLDEDDFTFTPGALAGLLAIPLGSGRRWGANPVEVNPWDAAMNAIGGPEVLF
jgi:cytosine/adenosine deaminase-related metal-dependent hydrolase